MASRIGRTLREARIERGIELSEVERVTRIRVRFLRAMEEDRWDELPAPAYARGFLAAYARFLGLDERELVDEYRRSVKGADRPVSIPHSVVKPGALGRRRPVKPFAVVAGLAATLALALVILIYLGGSDDDGGMADRGAGTAGSAAPTTASGEPPGAASAQRPTARAGEVSVELRSTGVVWVCLEKAEGRPPVNGETLTANEVRGPFGSRAFELTLGNGSVEMTVDGQPVEIPPLAEPLGYRITPKGVRELDPSSRPTCL